DVALADLVALAEVDGDDPAAEAGTEGLAAAGVVHLDGRGHRPHPAHCPDHEVDPRQAGPEQSAAQQAGEQQRRAVGDPRRPGLQGLAKLGAFGQVLDPVVTHHFPPYIFAPTAWPLTRMAGGGNRAAASSPTWAFHSSR